METSTTICTQCQKEFLVLTKELQRNNGKFCSHACSTTYHNLLKPKLNNVVCSNCGLTFHKSPSKMKDSKSGLFFCNRICKDKAQQLGGLKQIQPQHYHSGLAAYREIAKRHHKHCCNRCGYDKLPILEVHHIDRNRNNNLPTNLEILCSRCHDEEHYLAKDGKWSR